ncbi:hypothetical protein [Fimbriiglobus ruber]|uniref:Carboxypeptidase regulatory-like domain-containing protein n=1 Tax=Fimbriiglobus ruber TaxID=1908690 RepID=A0A225DCK3_9BACT|nr:hypothetical protein [Fimbriiglobus ruber]OWK35046.1 hypothetical protein FRUB_09888 [Fimbriiglobus ruber]
MSVDWLKIRHVATPIVFFSSALLIGCGGSDGLAEVSGVVSLNGKSLSTGSVVFIGSDKVAPVVVPIEADGHYSARKVPSGTVTVTVHSPNPKDEADSVRAKNADRAGVTGKAPPPPGPDPKLWFPIPTKYNDPSKSGLSYPIKPGSNSLNIELK